MTQVGNGIEDGTKGNSGGVEGCPSECDRIAASRALRRGTDKCSPRRRVDHQLTGDLLP